MDPVNLPRKDVSSVSQENDRAVMQAFNERLVLAAQTPANSLDDLSLPDPSTTTVLKAVEDCAVRRFALRMDSSKQNDLFLHGIKGFKQALKNVDRVCSNQTALACSVTFPLELMLIKFPIQGFSQPVGLLPILASAALILCNIRPEADFYAHRVVSLNQDQKRAAVMTCCLLVKNLSLVLGLSALSTSILYGSESSLWFFAKSSTMAFTAAAVWGAAKLTRGFLAKHFRKHEKVKNYSKIFS